MKGSAAPRTWLEHRSSATHPPASSPIPPILTVTVVLSLPPDVLLWASHRAMALDTTPATHSSEPSSAAILMAADEGVFLFSMVFQHEYTPAATPATPVTATLASVVTASVSSAPSRRPFNHEKASAFLEKLSATELRTVLRVLRIKGRIQANMADKRAIAASCMEDQNIDDEQLEALMDDADLVAPATPIFGARPPTGASASALVLSAASGRSGAGGSSASAAPAPLATSRSPLFTANDNDMARLADVATDPLQLDTIQADNQPLSRAELDKPRQSLWDAVFAPAFNYPEYKPARATPVDCVLASDLRGMDPTRFTCSREASKLETIYRALRSNYTKAYSSYTRSGQMEGGIFKDYTNGDHQLLYLHCLLFDNSSVDFVLRPLPQAAQAEVGLPGSAAVGRGPGHPGSAPHPLRKRPRLSEVVIGGTDNLTTALVSIGNSSGPAGGDVVGHHVAAAFDNSEAIGAIWTQLKAARDAVSEDPSDVLAISKRVHFEQQLQKLMDTE